MTQGTILVGAEARHGEHRFQAINPATDALLPEFHDESSERDVADAAALAHAAAPAFAALAPATRAAFLDAVAEAILAIGDPLIETAQAETGLPRARLEGERMRTVGQLRLFAAELRKGEWLDATIDSALPDRTPPRPDLRRVNTALGPVAVFGASNFPLAFSVAGGDTASALAAGCPVVVKGHPAHPGTGLLVARAIVAAVKAAGLPDGVFSYLPGISNTIGAALVADPRIRAVGFTGSRGGGLALAAIAAKRAEPIPVYAEMSSINPVVLMPGALEANASALGAAFVASLTMGAGQFCTNPGLVLAIDSPALDQFVDAAAAALDASVPQVMLAPHIQQAYARGVARLDAHDATQRLASGIATDQPNRCVGALFATSADAFLANRDLGDEVFGSASLLVRCRDKAELLRVIAGLEGQLTATIHLDPSDEPHAGDVLDALRDRAGRVLANGWPTGVEVCAAMVHGGPFPATTDARTTSVGTLALARFLRPVSYQAIPDALLPPALQQDNPWGIARRVDGQWQRGA